MLQIIDDITDYESARGAHRCGTVSPGILWTLSRLLPTPLEQTVETGCGKSTVLLSRTGARHTVFTVDDSEDAHGSLRFVRECPLLDAAVVTFVLGPTQVTLPQHHFDGPIDLALIDGPHAWPFPELEYFYLYPHLRHGALLIVDDLHIPTVARMWEVLCEEPMFVVAARVGHTGFLRRTDAPTFPRTGDGWNRQKFNARRFVTGVASA
jgi:hypothetical protein